jgi:hypothetical protein
MFRAVFLAMLLLAAASGSSLAPRAGAEEITTENAVEAGREALSGKTRYPWYDRETDSVRRIEVAPAKTDDLPERRSRWSANRNPKSPPTGAAQGASLFAPILQGLGLALLVALLVAIAVLIARAALNREASGEGGGHVVETSHEVDRVENLPFQLKRPTGDFLAEAERLYSEGRYSEAIVYLFSHQLVELDKRHVIRLSKGKTNRQYLREMRHRPALRGMLETTMIAFEDVFFGHHPLDRERFETCWNALDAFQQELERVEHAAA